MDQGIVHLVPTLHQHHAAAPGYGFDALTRVLEQLRPQLLVVELTARDLARRRPQRVKQEYQRSVFPYIERQGTPAIPMEPDEPLFSQLVGAGLEAQQRYQSANPRRFADYQRATGELLAVLLRSWDSPGAVDSERTERLLQAKHVRENELFGPACQDAWDRWNEHFAQTIAGTAREHRGQRIVVLAGVEHGYWLRPRLQQLAQADGGWTVAPRIGEAVLQP